MKEYRYILEPYKGMNTRYTCPGCNKRKVFARYIDSKTGEHLPDQYGKCNREIKCGYHSSPYHDGYSQRIWEQEKGSGINFKRMKLIPYRPRSNPKIKALINIPYEILKATRKGYEKNNFIQNLLHHSQFSFDAKDIEQVIKLYHLGTICKGERTGAITFPFIDSRGNISTIQAKQFDETNHTISTDFLHSIYERDCKRNNKPLPDWLKYYLKNETKVTCLFGEHLLSKYQINPIALVEAPKTAILGTLYFGLPDNPKNFLWLAVYNLSSLNIEKCKVLQGRKIVLIPDLNAYENWSNKAKQFQKQMPGTTFKVSDLIQRFAPNENKKEGEDIADFLTRMDWRAFKKERPEPIQPVIFKHPFSWKPESLPIPAKKIRVNEAEKKTPITWSHEVNELEKYFSLISLPDQPLKLNTCSTIANVPLFIETHFATLKKYDGNKNFLPFLNRLQDLKQLLNTL